MDLCELFIYANSMEGERFVPVKGFEGRFWVSDFGRIISHDHRKNTIKFLKCHLDSSGYCATQLRMKPDNRKVRMHVLVAEHFVQKEKLSHNIVNHMLGIKTNNYYKDLEWTNHDGNVKHAIRTGLFNIKGEKHPNSKLTESSVLQIRSLYKSGLTQKQIGQRFGIGRRQAGDIINRKNWGWLL